MLAAVQQAAPEQRDVARDERASKYVTHPAKPREGVDLEQLRFEIMTRFRRTLAYLAK